MWLEEFAFTWREAGVVTLAALLIYVALIFFSRLVGPRSFAQMTAFDFAVTVALGRRHGLDVVVDNTPQLVMLGSEILQDHLERAKLTDADLRQSLRKAGITRLEQVEAVVMERDGSISVLRSDLPVDPYLVRVLIAIVWLPIQLTLSLLFATGGMFLLLILGMVLAPFIGVFFLIRHLVQSTSPDVEKPIGPADPSDRSEI